MERMSPSCLGTGLAALAAVSSSGAVIRARSHRSIRGLAVLLKRKDFSRWLN
jgi:hypothetical protein